MFAGSPSGRSSNMKRNSATWLALSRCAVIARDVQVYIAYNKPGCALARFSLHDDRTLFLFVFTADVDRLPAKLDVAAQKAMLRERFAGDEWELPRILRELDRTDDLYFDRVSQIKMPAWSRGRVALVGDAAFCVSLMAGQGSALAMTSAYVLAGELAEANGNHAEAFEKYERLLRDYVATKQRGAKGFARAFAPQTRWGLVFRNQVTKTFSDSGLGAADLWYGYRR